MNNHGYRVDRPRQEQHLLRIPKRARRFRLVLEHPHSLHDVLEAPGRDAGRLRVPVWRCSSPLTPRIARTGRVRLQNELDSWA